MAGKHADRASNSARRLWKNLNGPAIRLAPRSRFSKRGRRIEQTTAEGILRTSYDGDEVLNEWEANTNQTARSSYLHGNGMLLARRDQRPNLTQTYRMTWNHLGSTSETVDEAGAVAAQYRYDAWGQFKTPPTATELETSGGRTLTGQKFDKETGLFAMGNGTRFYDADTGMFNQKDPVYGEADDPQSMSPYAYARNNPVSFTDPTGMTPQDGATQIYTPNGNGRVYQERTSRGYEITSVSVVETDNSGKPSRSHKGKRGKVGRSRTHKVRKARKGPDVEVVTESSSQESEQIEPERPSEYSDSQPGDGTFGEDYEPQSGEPQEEVDRRPFNEEEHPEKGRENDYIERLSPQERQEYLDGTNGAALGAAARGTLDGIAGTTIVPVAKYSEN